jgi:hypothetical protein
MTNPQKVERAYFQIEGSSDKIDVHFNPDSMQFTITNNLRNQGRGNSTKQYVSDSTGKLTMELVFDSTGSGEDIRLKTVRIAQLMEPQGSASKKTPAVVNFEWGLYKFSGMIEAYKETIDYFSADGVPLRASVNLTLSSQDRVFEGGSSARKAATGGSAGLPSSAVPATPAAGGKGATDLATKAGNPEAAKNIASNNGLDSMRFPASAALELDASVSLQGPSGFASTGVQLSVGGGAGFGLDAGLELSGGVSVGSALSAGVSAGAGAFSGLQASSPGASISAGLNLDPFMGADHSAGIGLDAGSVGIGGSAGLQGSASMKAEVGKAGELKTKLEFDGV